MGPDGFFSPATVTRSVDVWKLADASQLSMRCVAAMSILQVKRKGSASPAQITEFSQAPMR
jgi:hypothetical protein